MAAQNEIGGYVGKILRVDLTTERISEEVLDRETLRLEKPAGLRGRLQQRFHLLAQEQIVVAGFLQVSRSLDGRGDVQRLAEYPFHVRSVGTHGEDSTGVPLSIHARTEGANCQKN